MQHREPPVLLRRGIAVTPQGMEGSTRRPQPGDGACTHQPSEHSDMEPWQRGRPRRQLPGSIRCHQAVRHEPPRTIRAQQRHRGHGLEPIPKRGLGKAGGKGHGRRKVPFPYLGIRTLNGQFPGQPRRLLGGHGVYQLLLRRSHLGLGGPGH